MDLSAQSRPHEGPEDDEASSLSDYDSEWTQVTEDDSDFPPLSAGFDRPLSRTDTADDSVDGDIWEGLADADEPQSDLEDAVGGADQEGATHIAAYHIATQSLSASVATQKSDDEIESDALNCSVVGTLTASRTRSATSSLHASLTESQSKLRLSFPDPLTSRDNLDAISATSDAELSPTNFTEEPRVISVASESTVSSFEAVESPSITAPTEADACIEAADRAQDDKSGRHVLDILLYGSASTKRWEIACKVMQVALDADEVLELENGKDQSVHVYRLWASSCSPAGAIDTHCLIVRVLDRTASSSGETSQSLESDVPSLAIVLLPSSFPSELPQHTYYLPLISSHSLDFFNHPSSFSTFSEQIVSDSAQYAWNHLGVAFEKTIRIGGKRSETIHNVSALDVVPRQDLVRAFRCVFEDRPAVKHREVDDCARLFGNRWHVFLFVVATAVAVSIGSFQPNGSSQHSLLSVNSPDTNIPLRTPSPIDSTVSSALVLTTSSDGVSGSRSGYQSLATFISRSMAQTNFSPFDGASRALAKTTPLVASVPPAPEKASDSEAGPSSLSSSRTQLWAKKLNLGLYNPTDMMVRPAAGVDVVTEKPKSLLPTQRAQAIAKKVVPKFSDDVKAVGLRAVHTSLSLISSAGKAIMEVAGRDVFALYEAIDELLRVIRRQIDNARSGPNQPQTSVDLVSRNARARQNARRLRHMGEKMFKAAGERLGAGKAEAVKVAHQIRDVTRAPSREDAKRLKQVGETFLKAASERLQAGSSEAVKVAHQLRDGTKSIHQEVGKSRATRRQKRQEKKRNGANGLSDTSSADVQSDIEGKGMSGKREDLKSSRRGKKQQKRMLRGQSLGGKDEVRRDSGESRGVLEALMDVVH